MDKDILNPQLKKANELATLFESIGKEIAITLSIVKDPALKAILNNMQELGNKIATFFLRIKKLIRQETADKRTQFVAQYFIKNFSIISENTRAAKNIINYVLNKLDWLKDHSNRIIGILKSLYADLLYMQIDCEESYRSMFDSELGYDFGMNPEEKVKEAEKVIAIDKAYKILGLKEGEKKEMVQIAFRKLVSKLHPDLNPKAVMDGFVTAKAAYKTILKTFKQ